MKIVEQKPPKANVPYLLKTQIEHRKDHYELIKAALLKIYRQKIYFNRLYRASEDGWHINDFHQMSDNQGPILILIETTDKEFLGGFSSIGWDSVSAGDTDPKSFIFSSKAQHSSKSNQFIYNLNFGKEPEINLFFHETMGP